MITGCYMQIMKHERLWTMRNKLRASEGMGVGEWDRPVMGSEEGTYCMVHWVLYAIMELCIISFRCSVP